MMDFEEYYQDWIDQAKDYPTKALISVLVEQYRQQAELIKQLGGKLDGSIWSRENWE